MGYRQYTHCVQPDDYVDNVPPSGFGNTVASILTNPIAAIGWASTVCPYLLGGKLVCLNDGTPLCAIGRVLKFEKPSDKSFPDNIDNDFSLNMLLAPHDLSSMTAVRYIDNYNAVANDQMQGFLLQMQPEMPDPRQENDPDDDSPPAPLPDAPDLRYQGYTTNYPDSNNPDYDPAQNPFQVPGSDGHPFYVPSLHIEFEGSRIHDVCAAISTLQGPVSSFCDVPIIGWIACFAVDLVLSPILAAAIAIAWANADDGDYADALVGGGQLALGDLVVATGRWVYDAGHQGWNELHPGMSIQLISHDQADYDLLDIPVAPPDFLAWRGTWCDAIANVPPYAPPGTKPTDMTPQQTVTYVKQLAPENQWIFHPSVDGCDPGHQPPPPPR
jgi:hypothetical protein